MIPAPVSRSAFHVRVAGPEDAATLADLGARTFDDTFGSDNPVSDMATYLACAFRPDIQAAELADPRCVFLVAESERQNAGYARLRFGESRSSVAGIRPVEIDRFYADRPWIGKGVGTALMRASLDLARDGGCDVVWLDVWEHNPRAIGFYRSWGFEVVGTQNFRLGQQSQTDLIMARVMGARGTEGAAEASGRVGSGSELRRHRSERARRNLT